MIGDKTEVAYGMVLVAHRCRHEYYFKRSSYIFNFNDFNKILLAYLGLWGPGSWAVCDGLVVFL